MDEGSDRLSNLPDSVLVEILSPLNAKEVFQTRVLSKRWLNVWASVPRLDFNSNDFNSARDPNRFMNFVSRFLDLRDDSVNTDKFSLTYYRRGNSVNTERFLSRFFDHRDDSVNTDKFSLKYYLRGDSVNTERFVSRSLNPIETSRSVKKWILYALNHNPKEFYFCVRVTARHENVQLLERLFTCESLEVACWSIFGTGDRYKFVPDRVCLPNLRVLHLTNLLIEKEYMEKIFRGCPVLKRLSLFECDLMMDEILFQNLEWLDISDCNFDSKSNPKTCLISAPNLEYLELALIDAMEIGLKLKDMSKVNTARITFVDSRSSSDLLSSLSSMENLRICYDNLEELLENEIPRCPTFYSLKIATFEGFIVHKFLPILLFLAHCPNLEKLVLVHQEWKCEHGEEERDKIVEELLEQTETICCEHLKLVHIISHSASLHGKVRVKLFKLFCIV